MTSLFRFNLKVLIWLLILAGLVVGALRLTLANVGLFRADIETWVSHELAPGISFGDIRFYWNGIDPVLELKKSAISLPDRSQSIVVDILAIQLDLWDTVILGTPVVVEVAGSIDKVVIRKDSDKRWWLNNFRLKASEAGRAFGDLENWLSSVPHFLQLELKRVIIEDASRQLTHQINNVLADIQHHKNVTHVRLSANLPEALGGDLEVKSLLEGDNGLAYLKTDRIKLSPLVDLLDLPPENFSQTELAGQVWINLQEHRLSAVNGAVRITKALYQSEADESPLPFQFEVDFSAEKAHKNWHLASRIQNIRLNQQDLPDIDTEMRFVPASGARQIQGWISGLAIPDYRDLLSSFLADEYRKLVSSSAVQGTVKDIWLTIPVADPAKINLSARLENIKSSRVNLIPAVNQFDADVVYAGQQVSVDFSSDDLDIDFGDQFRAPFILEAFTARAELAYSGDELMLSVSDLKAENADIHVGGRMWMESDLRSSPFMAMHLEFDEGKASRKSNYLPVKLLPEKALKWIDDSIRAGDISNGNLIYHGRLQSIKALDQAKSGTLYADFDLNDAEVLFDPAWEMARQADARLQFHNMGINIDLQSVDYDQVRNASANIRLPNYANASIIVDIQGSAKTGDALSTWLATPVGEQYRSIAENFQDPRGNIKTRIRLLLPLESETQKQDVRVDIQLDKAALKAPGWGVALSRASGQMTVTGDSITAKGIKANFFEDPVSIDVATDQHQRQTLIIANGLIDTGQLLNLLPHELTREMDGKSQWKLNLAIAEAAQSGHPLLTINAKSDLKGTAISFPEPFSKEPAHNRQLVGKIVLLANGDILFNADYLPNIEIRGQVDKSQSKDYQLVDLDMAFSSPLRAVQESGIHLYGSLQTLPLDKWIARHQAEKTGQESGTPGLMPLLKTIDLEVAEVAVSGQSLNKVDFQLRQSEGGLDGKIQSQQATGEFFVPWRDSVQNPVVIDMDYLHVTQKVGFEAVSDSVPDDFFNARIRSKIFAYEGREVTDLEIDTSRDGEFLLIDRLAFHRNKIHFEANGYWLYSATTKLHDSFFAINVYGSEFGQTIAALGFGDAIGNGKIKFTGQVEWPGSIMNPGWEIVRGTGHLKLEDGILKDIEPGTGRFVGLFSLSALPRRLALDFSDVLFDGLEFDVIRGNMELKGPDLYTNNLKLDGPAAEVKLVGKTGLRNREYDQKIYVTPKIRHALPVIGSIAAGSTVGWALLLLQNLLKSPIDESLEIEYSVTGSWDDPVIQTISKPKQEVDETRGGVNFEK